MCVCVCVYVSKWVDIIFFLFHNENKNLLKFFVEPAIMINKSNIFFKKKKKRS